jgi:hypothetical protein
MLGLGLFSEKNFDILAKAKVEIQSSAVVGGKVLAVIACDGDDPRSFLSDELALLDSGEYHLIALSSETSFEEMGEASYSVLNSEGSFASPSELEELEESVIPVESQKALDIEVTLGCVFKGKAKQVFQTMVREDPERFASLLAVGGDPNNHDDADEYLVHRLDFPRERGWTGISEEEIKSDGLEPFFCETSNYLDPEFKLPECADQVTERSICSELKDLASCGELDESLTKINYYLYWIGGSPDVFGDLDESESHEYIGPMVVATFRNSGGCLASITWEEITNWDFED